MNNENKNPNVLDNYSDVLTVLELAAVLRIGKNAAYALVRDGAVSSVRIGRKYLIPKNRILAFLSKMCDNMSVD